MRRLTRAKGKESKEKEVIWGRVVGRRLGLGWIGDLQLGEAKTTGETEKDP